MANSAPRATRNSIDAPLPNWGVEVRYDTQNDLLYVRRWSSDLLSGRGPTAETSFSPVDIEDALSLVQVAVRTKGAPRLF